MVVLDGVWRTDVMFRGKVEAGIDSHVPGNFELDLHRAGLVPDPYIRMNGQALRHYEFCDWVMRRTFEFHGKPGARCRLVLDGVDAIAEVKLNGRTLGRCENAFISHVFAVDEALRDGENLLEVTLLSATRAAAGATRVEPGDYSFLHRNLESLRIRRPAHVWGWDITPRMALGGIFKSVRIEEIPDDEIIDCFHGVEKHEKERALLACHYNLRLADPEMAGYTLRVSGRCGGSSFELVERVSFTSGIARFAVVNP